jgi:hypothetical protein
VRRWFSLGFEFGEALMNRLDGKVALVSGAARGSLVVDGGITAQ